MEGKMKVCVLTGKQKLEWVERDIPQPGNCLLYTSIRMEILSSAPFSEAFRTEGRRDPSGLCVGCMASAN